MSNPSGDLPKLFRSLRPDDADFQAAAHAAAREVEQRWPIFKAVSPQKPEQTPTLTEQERQRWSGQEAPAGGRERKQALSLPGLADKLAHSLRKMSGQVTAEVLRPQEEPPAPAVPAKPPKAAAPATRRARIMPPSASAQNTSLLFGALTPAEPIEAEEDADLGLFGGKAASTKKTTAARKNAPTSAKPPKTAAPAPARRARTTPPSPPAEDASALLFGPITAFDAPEDEDTGVGLFEPKTASAKKSARTASSGKTAADDEIKNVLTRLEPPKKTPKKSKPADTPSSFLGRLGKK